MAIQSASAKLYTGIRCWCVDKNISAALTASFSLGNQRQPSPVLVGGIPTVFADVLVNRVKRYIADLVFTPSVALTNQRYRTYGGGNNVITPGSPRVINNTNNWRVTASVVCKFPTYFRIDVDKLQLPQGTTCTVSFEEDWIRDGDYLETTRASSPAVGNFFTFRTPWKGASFINSVFTLPGNFLYRRRPGSMFINSAFTPVMSAKITRRGVIDLQSAFTTVIRAGEIVRLLSRADLFVVAGPMGPGATPYLEGNGYGLGTGLSFWPQGFPGIVRLRGDTVAITKASTASLSAEVFNLPFIVPLTNFSSAFTTTPNADAFKGVGTPNLSSQSSLTVSTRVDYNSFVAAIQSQATVVCRPVQSAKADLVVQSSLTANAITSESILLEIVVPSGGVGPRTFGFDFAGNVLVNVNWGDGLSDLNIETTGTKLHTYASPGTYVIAIDRVSTEGIPLEEWRVRNAETRVINGASASINPPSMVRRCLSFGKLNTINLTNTFNGCTNLTSVPTFLPATVQALWDTFNGCTQFNDNNVTLWNTTNVTNMNGTFQGCSVFNRDISVWNTANVTGMARMFAVTNNFNQNIGSWNVSKVSSFSSMFSSTAAFNGNIENWTNIGAGVTGATRISMGDMFNGAQAFNRPIGNWNTSLVNSMARMFQNAPTFNQNLSGWCVSLIATKPTNFDTNTPAWVKTGRQPVWGTCP